MKCFCLFTVISVNYYSLAHGFSNCGTCTTIGMPTIVYWHTELIKIKMYTKIENK
jgi:hypothetical protein